jgi:hypothetical protein
VVQVRDYWVDRKQITGFIGSIFIIFGIFLPIYSINLIIINQFPISLIEIPLMGKPIALILVALGILSIVAIAFEEYALLYITGLVSLFAVLATFVIIELGLVILSDTLPRVYAVVNFLLGYEFGWFFLLSGCVILLITPKL